MPVESLPWSIQGQSHPATVARNATAGMLGAPAAAVSPAAQILTAGGSHGVVGAGDLAVAQNGTPNMSVNVAAGRAFIRGTETASLNQGAYSFFNDGTVNLAVAASDPTNPRRDLVVAQVRDANSSGAANDARLTVITGTPAAVPADPTIPANCLVLARIAVAAGSTSVLNAAITDLRTRAAALGGIQVCTSTTRPSGASVYEGLIIYETDTDRVVAYDGTAWVQMQQFGAWTSFTPTWSSTGTAPSIGNGILDGAWSKRGRTVEFRERLLFGSTTTLGTGVYFLTVPFASFGSVPPQIGTAMLFRNSTSTWTRVSWYLPSGSNVLQFPLGDATVNQFGAASPFAPANGDLFIVEGKFEAAS